MSIRYRFFHGSLLLTSLLAARTRRVAFTLTLSLALGCPISHAATLDITVASGNISPIAKVVLDDNGTIVTQTSSQSGVIANRGTELNLVEVELVNGFVLKEFSVGLDVTLQGFATWQPTSGIGVLNSDGTQTNLVAGAANIEAFRLAALDTVSNNNLNNYVLYDGIQPSAPPSGIPDFDVIYNVPFQPDDYILVQERDGNTFFEVTPLDVNGDPLAGANVLRFDSQYDWNTGYANSSYQTGQPYEFSVTLASNFFVGTAVTPQPVYGLRIDNDGQADVKFFLLSDDPFPPPNADLEIVKTALQNPVLQGQNLTYTLTVTNNGPADGAGVVVTDALPAGVTWVSTTPSQGSCSAPDGITCELGTITNGNTATVTVVVTVN